MDAFGGSPRPRSPGVRIAGIPIRVQPTFLILAALLGLTPDRTPGRIALWVVIVAVSVLVHELGHAFTFRHYGHDATITLTGFGGVTMGTPRPGGSELRDGQNIVVSLAGPFAGMAVGVAALVVRSQVEASTNLHDVLGEVVLVNLGWGVLNLLPIVPLDGGHVLVSGLRILAGDRGARIAFGISAAVAITAGLVAISMGYVFAGLLAGMFAASAISGFRETSGRTTRSPEALQERAAEASSLLAAGRPDDAVTGLRAVLADGPPPALAATTTQVLGWALLAANRLDAVAEHVERERRLLHPFALLDGMRLRALGDPKAAERLALGLATEAVEPPVWAGQAAWLPPELLAVLYAELGRQPAADVGFERLARWLHRAGRPADALAAAASAAGQDLDTPGLCDLAAEISDQLGRPADAAIWRDRAISRRRATPPGRNDTLPHRW